MLIWVLSFRSALLQADTLFSRRSSFATLLNCSGWSHDQATEIGTVVKRVGSASCVKPRTVDSGLGELGDRGTAAGQVATVRQWKEAHIEEASAVREAIAEPHPAQHLHLGVFVQVCGRGCDRRVICWMSGCGSWRSGGVSVSGL